MREEEEEEEERTSFHGLLHSSIAREIAESLRELNRARHARVTEATRSEEEHKLRIITLEGQHLDIAVSPPAPAPALHPAPPRPFSSSPESRAGVGERFPHPADERRRSLPWSNLRVPPRPGDSPSAPAPAPAPVPVVASAARFLLTSLQLHCVSSGYKRSFQLDLLQQLQDLEEGGR
eukprot:722116-Hanusia_phi.AAC.1